ncbi:hypothetical protein, partial [Zymomonas mobilis]|uniref:hypothetical protein n=1 Tax=Zymomonas mobilis TaxID=542 RepID=UPI0039E8A0E0
AEKMESQETHPNQRVFRTFHLDRAFRTRRIVTPYDKTVLLLISFLNLVAAKLGIRAFVNST